MQNTKKVFETLDLVRLIYSFGDPKHRRFTQHITREVYPNNELSKIQCSLSECIDDIPIPVLVKALKKYKRCYCCQRHNRFKPYLSEGQVRIFTGSVHESHPKECDCSCRHYSRYIIKHFFD